MRIKSIRKKRCMTQDELAKKINVKQATVAMWETNKSFPTADKLPEIAKVLDCTIDDLFHDE